MAIFNPAMEQKLTLYDLLAVIIPGGILVLALAFLTSILPVLQPIKELNGFTETTIFLLVAYFVGHLIQAIGKWYEKLFLIPSWDGFPSTRFIRCSDSHYSEEFKNSLRKVIESKFEMHLPDERINKKDADKRLQEAFNLCYSFVVDRQIAGMAYLMNATYGLFRGLVISSRLSALIFLAACAILLIRGDYPSAAFYGTMLFLLLLSGRIFKLRAKQRGELFADYVYRSFFSYYMDNRKGN